MPTQNVDAMAIENASWMALTMPPMSGATSGLLIRRHDRQDPRAEVARAGQVDRASAATAAELRDQLLAARRPSTSWIGISAVSRSAKSVPAIVRPDRSADLLEERQAARRVADPVGRHGVLDDEREDRERRADAEAGQDHPQPQDRPVGVGVEVRHQEQPDGRSSSDPNIRNL